MWLLLLEQSAVDNLVEDGIRAHGSKLAIGLLQDSVVDGAKGMSNRLGHGVVGNVVKDLVQGNLRTSSGGGGALRRVSIRRSSRVAGRTLAWAQDLTEVLLDAVDGGKKLTRPTIGVSDALRGRQRLGELTLGEG
ncbi:uncharacterized protein MONBRDRAFT_13169 [Monosiga brevicollis MX1]|uniref:Uncharacterized protein n=1 Tax=Monosiga brevicollis TaxID=81824 RepID=A9VEH3_MONBE|nr:uncharacterized protein MONBRDRAFT_13169 [Monosiga brevicollis MX1]EDQ84068.1 predicted protein [Monosiga brevicollis MX1]|eukprot:XP_001751120.1 hypothetical protein [Monosiga brevicollis MX1]